MILDTCALLWLAQGGGRLSSRALSQIGAAPAVYVSAISGFEVGVKYRKGKLALPAQPLEWFEAVVDHHGLQVLPVDLQTCIRSIELPAVHADPVDRIIVATAERQSLPVVTADAIFTRYGVEVVA